MKIDAWEDGGAPVLIECVRREIDFLYKIIINVRISKICVRKEYDLKK